MTDRLFGNPDPRPYARTEAPIWAYARTVAEWLILPLTLAAVTFAVLVIGAWMNKGGGLG
jgi:hypothetical protein